MDRFPPPHEAGVRTLFCGPESFTPDLTPLLGEAPEPPRLLRRVRAQLARHPASGGGIGRLPAHWILTACRRRRHRDEHRPPPRAHHGVPASISGPPAPSSCSAWCTRPTIRWGRCARPAARRCRRGTTGWPAPTRVLQGRERVGEPRLVRRPRASKPEVTEPLSWGRQHWFGYWEAEHRATREGVIADGHVVHVEVPGPGPRCRPWPLERISANWVDGEPGVITYAQRLERGWHDLEADLTVTKLDDDRVLGRRVGLSTPARARCGCARHLADSHASSDRRHGGVRPDQHPGSAVARSCSPR